MSENLWHVRLSRKAKKSLGKLPKPVFQTLTSLMRQLETSGPARGDWPTTASSAPNATIAIVRKGDLLTWQFRMN